MSPDILLTPPLLARRLIAGFVIPWMLSLNTCNQVHITKDWVLRKSLLYLSVSLCSPLPKAFAPLAPPVIGHSSPFSSFLVRSEFRLFPKRLNFGHVRFPWFVLVLATATTPLRRDGEKAKSENVSTNDSARGERRPMGGDLVFVALFNCLE